MFFCIKGKFGVLNSRHVTEAYPSKPKQLDISVRENARKISTDMLIKNLDNFSRSKWVKKGPAQINGHQAYWGFGKTSNGSSTLNFTWNCPLNNLLYLAALTSSEDIILENELEILIKKVRCIHKPR